MARSQRSISRGSAVRQYGTLGGTPKAPVNTAVATIAGTTTAGQTLTATAGTWANTPTATVRQWFRGKEPIPGATALTYVLTAADVGHRIAIEERVGNAVGFNIARSAYTAIVV